MGAWGAGLYASDFALDLRSTLGAVLRLPYEADRLLAILEDVASDQAGDQSHEDYTTFWLVVADQFSRRALFSGRVHATALRLIDEGVDLAMQTSLGMAPEALKRRRAMLAELRTRLCSDPRSTKPRPVLRKPQPYVIDVGDLFVYPTSRGQCINPYLASKEHWLGWSQDGWGAAVIVERGRAFDFLAWYRPLRLLSSLPTRPGQAELLHQGPWGLGEAGTLTKLHLKRMEVATVGAISVDAARLSRVFPVLSSPIPGVVSDICISNTFYVDLPGPRLQGLSEIISS